VRIPTYSAFDSLSFRVEGAGRVVLLGYSLDSTVKNEAERRIKKIEQVEELVNLIEVLPYSGSDDRIRAQAYAAIYGHPSLQRYAPGGGITSMDRRNFARDLQVGIRGAQITRGPHPIHILVKNGNLALVGQVRSAMDSQIAEVQARSLSGVFSVENHLQVSAP
jgi:osmotically-inducible protein OsmY